MNVKDAIKSWGPLVTILIACGGLLVQGGQIVRTVNEMHAKGTPAFQNFRAETDAKLSMMDRRIILLEDALRGQADIRGDLRVLGTKLDALAASLDEHKKATKP